MKTRRENQPYYWYVKKCQEAINDCVPPSNNPEFSKTCNRNPKKIDAHITEWYMYGLVQEIFDIAWDDFKYRVLDGWNNRNLPRPRRISYYRFRSLTHCEFRGHTHYTRNRWHLPKAESPQSVWRKYKYFQRDKSRHRGSHSKFARGSNYKQFCKTKSSSKHRNWVKENLARANYDSFDQNVDRERKYFADPWMWD